MLTSHIQTHLDQTPDNKPGQETGSGSGSEPASGRESQGPDQVLNGHLAGPETNSETSRSALASLKELARPQARVLGNSRADKLGTGQAH